MKKLIRLLLLVLVIVGIIKAIPMLTEYLFPFNYNMYVEDAAERYGVDKNLVYAVIKAESNFDAKSESKRGAKGLMQIMDGTAAWCAHKIGLDSYDIFEPKDNIEIGVYYLSYLLDYYNGNEKSAISAYNAGYTNVDKWIDDTEYSADGENLDDIPFAETEKYVRKIKLYKRIYAWRE
ncbi:MAG: lytic transglycosylase domain-containing protein [Clostridia bacterium]|nr:lytic transglycosylase domain-containing protein [Clostridia bacterium]